MFKKLLTLLAMSLLALFSTGCVRYVTNIEIDRLNRLNLMLTCSYNMDEVRAVIPDYNMETTKAFTFEEKGQKELEAQGYTVQDYKDGVLVGQRITRQYKKTDYFTPNDLPDGYTLAEDVAKPVEIDKTLLKTTYYIHWNYDPERLKTSHQNGQAQPNMPKELKGKKIKNAKIKQPKAEQKKPQAPKQEQPQAPKEEYRHLLNLDGTNPTTEFVVKLTGKVLKSNAKEFFKETNEYQWLFESTKGGEIILKVERYNPFGILLTVLSIIAMIFIIKRRFDYRKKDKQNAELTE
ncbi:MAG: hypothetical protein IJ877_04005 [Candidatus Gastranaerophilales bacterium]|nr:hypothetical protein [Candidatus Gastranaerophilales bacterium]